MTKEALIELVKERLSGDGTELHPGYIEYNIALAFNSLYYTSCLKGIKNYDLHIYEYENQAVLHNNVTDTYYISLPYAPVQMPRNGQGVMRVAVMQGRSIKFIASTESESDIFYSLEANNIKGLISYIVYNDRIVFDRNPGVAKVKFNMIKGFEIIDYDDEIYVPAGQDDFFIKSLVEYISGTPDDKQINDNNKKTP